MMNTDNKLDIEIRVDDEQAFRQVLDRFRHASPPAGHTAEADDRSSIGAFDSEWIIGLILGLPIGVTGSLIAAWIKDTLSPPPAGLVVVLIVDKEINLGAENSVTEMAIAMDDSIKQRDGGE